ncbi:methyltransferase domain-containing protein [Simiduia aestuariiviva]|uniref:tRNA 5-carboxymethoxyuridine methyltransferase n=1 Tax=Simiduia aestuariiviva TaxID=1510459 RepID=A0A839UTI4_9GAMM|nr:methyltransferase domain-containing protein [Simiduia aestuariiviva]MBB3168665.1 S-adenosylmethionine-dependent methyltransferase [Simiduia aestuariiviva]
MQQNPPGSKRPPLDNEDRNFDDLAPRFARNVYGGLKGRLRLAVLQRDFNDHVQPLLDSASGLEILDAGGGQGQFGLSLAGRHALTLCDISAEMLALARAEAQQRNLEGVAFEHASVQDLAQRSEHCARYRLVLCHAVLEWVADQRGLLVNLKELVCPGGVLSLTFYNRHGLVMKNLLRGTEPKILSGEFRPHRGSLTPTRPLDPAEVLSWLADDGWEILCHSGIRVFHDYQLTPESRHMAPDKLEALELQLSQQEPYRSLGRYQHVLLRRPSLPSTSNAIVS